MSECFWSCYSLAIYSHLQLNSFHITNGTYSSDINCDMEYWRRAISGVGGRRKDRDRANLIWDVLIFENLTVIPSKICMFVSGLQERTGMNSTIYFVFLLISIHYIFSPICYSTKTHLIRVINYSLLMKSNDRFSIFILITVSFFCKF